MAKVGNPRDFWTILKSVSANEIAQETNKLLKIAIVGDSAERTEVIHFLYASKGVVTQLSANVTPSERACYAEISEYDDFTHQAGFPEKAQSFDFVLDVGADRLTAPADNLIYTLRDFGGIDGTLERIIEDKPEWRMALARNFPVLRKRVGDFLVNQTAIVNAEFSLLTGITAAFPITGILLPVNALSDIVVLTKNQAMLALRLAAIYDLPVDYVKRSKELAPILGNAFGWRAIAREIIGMIPVGGMVVKAMIAYAGTATIGHAAQVYYETGENLSREQLKRIYKSAYLASRAKVQQISARVRRKGGENSNGSHQETSSLAPLDDVIEVELIPFKSEDSAVRRGDSPSAER